MLVMTCNSDEHWLTGLWLFMTRQLETISRPNAEQGPTRLPLMVSGFGTAA